MNEREVHSRFSPPYPHLYIYHLNASVPCDRNLFGETFIGNWEEEDSSFLFFSKPAEDIVKQVVSRHPGVSLLEGYDMSYEQWQGDAVTSFKAGRFLVQPPWEITENISRTTRRAHHTNRGATCGVVARRATGEVEAVRRSPKPQSGDLPIILDPGVVFGTGTHPTTRDCLTALEIAFSREKVITVLDLGTGTGLLALAAARLGARHTIAVDLNFLAVQTTADNIRRNVLEDRIIAVQGRAEEMVPISADLLIANIHYDVMQHIVASDSFLEKGAFILSGILRSQARELEARLAELKCSVLRRWVHEDTWFTFYGTTTLDQ